MAGVLIHEWVARAGGSENVLEAMADAFPNADLRVLWNDAPARFAERKVTESWLAHTPLRRSKALALPAMPLTWRRMNGSQDYEWMLVSSHLFAHHASFRGNNRAIPKLVYAHTPARYIWNPELDVRGDSAGVRAASLALRPLDRHRAKEARAVAANSEFVRGRIGKAWDLDATVIYPPVDVDKIGTTLSSKSLLSSSESRQLDSLPSQFVLGASRFIPYKKLDQVIRIGEQIGMPVVIAGRGPDESQLRQLASESQVPVTFVISPSDELLHRIYARANLFVFPAIEDFGIMPVEAMAAGTPVLANRIGGAAESVSFSPACAVVDFDDMSAAKSAAESTIAHGLRVDPAVATRFSRQRFIQQIREWVTSTVEVGA